MKKPLVLLLYNQPLLPTDHPDADQEHVITDVAAAMDATLRAHGYRTRVLALGPDPTALAKALKKPSPDVVFNLFEGHLDNPETESYVASLLEWSGIPFTGSPARTLSLARAKHTAKYLLQGAGLPTANFEVVHALPAPACRLPFPVIVKPALQDASVGMAQESVCTSQSAVDRRVRYLVETYGPPVVIEEYIPGREFNVPLIELPDLEVLTPTEIVFTGKSKKVWPIYTYGAKWNVDTPEYLPSRVPTDLPAALVRKLHRYAKEAYQLLGCRDYARVDFRVKPDGKPYVLEVNPNPDISDQADLTRCLLASGHTHEQFLIRLIEHALARPHAPRPTFAPERS